jgi:hypothetical protein
MSDLVERLRHVFDWEDGSTALLCGEAADEIKRLEDALLFISRGIRVVVGGYERPQDQATWLREFASEALRGIDPRTGKGPM